jgi:hypothetical protein
MVFSLNLLNTPQNCMLSGTVITSWPESLIFLAKLVGVVEYNDRDVRSL